MVHYLFQAALEETVENAEAVTEVVQQNAANGLIGQGLQITLIGMLILFVSLFVLWGVMELLVRLVKDGPKDEAEAEEASAAIETADAGDDEKIKAAAAAAAYVIAKK